MATLTSSFVNPLTLDEALVDHGPLHDVLPRQAGLALLPLLSAHLQGHLTMVMMMNMMMVIMMITMMMVMMIMMIIMITMMMLIT